ncbi:MAG: hypothetical protein LBM77_12700 [Spirochaetaceae bacterium]|jgi:maltose alpha-D-glucosyltransferase/alpha-amylase|nr:hypothetical protein [Spirochaetaceae bacterium]
MKNTPYWLEDACFYEIYPQTYYDTNGDGIGDFEGIIQKLDYIKGLGFNALWINPCFDSPFKDAGYDVRDYKKIAPRYGTNADAKRLFDEAHKRSMHVLFDLVPGHTSEEHEWFMASKQEHPAPEFANRYSWTDNWITWGVEGVRFVAGEAPRNGCYIINFFQCQPALNYGYYKPQYRWQLPPDHPDCIATREALKDIIRFWLDAGCDGFRVDMADSLVKLDSDDKKGTSAIWQNVRAMLDKDYPEAALVSEWARPPFAIPAGFHMDFLLDHPGGGANFLFRASDAYFKKDGKHDIKKFLDQYMPWYEATSEKGFISFITGNHDTPRLSFSLKGRELELAYAFIYTMPGVPFMYYGDEIAMRYIDGMPTKEGGYIRTGTRTPMQWAGSKTGNYGFSTADPSQIYLPVDASQDAPTVEAQEKDPHSMLNFVRALLQFRHANTDLQSKNNLEFLQTEADKPLVYKRGALTMALNVTGNKFDLDFTGCNSEPVFKVGDAGAGYLGPQSFAVYK